MVDDTTQKKLLREQIEGKRKELSLQIEASSDANVLYQLSVELDGLISQYMAC